MAFLLPSSTPTPDSQSQHVTPPVDGSLTIPQIYDWNYRHNNTYPVFRYAQDDRTVTTLTFGDVVPAIHRVARYVSRLAGRDPVTSEHKDPPVIALLGYTDTITYFTVYLGILRAGMTVFPISPRYAPHVIAHLLTETNASHVMYSQDLLPLLEGALDVIATRKDGVIQDVLYHKIPDFSELYINDPSYQLLPDRIYNYSTVTTIVHSTGSTSLPKPIRWNSRRELQAMMVPLVGSQDFRGTVMGCHGVELFHGFGLSFVQWVAASGMILATFKPSTPRVEPTHENLYNGFKATGAHYAWLSPIIIQDWASDRKKVDYLSQLRGLVYGGSHLRTSIGDYLASQGVHVYTLYGSSEVGLISQLLPDTTPLEWEYFSINRHCSARFAENANGHLELSILGTDTQELPLFNNSIDGYQAFTASDLFIRHPKNPSLFKILGRSDDQIMLANGETVHPTAIEERLCRHQKVSAAVMFGRHRPCPGVIIQLKTRQKSRKVVRSVHAMISDVNSSLPVYARIRKEMVVFTLASRPLPVTSKNVPNRPQVLKLYENRIAASYVKQSSSAK